MFSDTWGGRRWLHRLVLLYCKWWVVCVPAGALMKAWWKTETEGRVSHCRAQWQILNGHFTQLGSFISKTMTIQRYDWYLREWWSKGMKRLATSKHDGRSNTISWVKNGCNVMKQNCKSGPLTLLFWRNQMHISVVFHFFNATTFTWQLIWLWNNC